jgi:hypothetical protein
MACIPGHTLPSGPYPINTEKWLKRKTVRSKGGYTLVIGIKQQGVHK